MRTIAQHGLEGHVPHWDGQVWSCAGESCDFESTPRDDAARLHYYNNTERRQMVTLPDEEDL